jgi:hypothetical protein
MFIYKARTISKGCLDKLKVQHMACGDFMNITFKSTILKALQCLLPVLTLSEKECNRIIRPILDAGLNKA